MKATSAAYNPYPDARWSNMRVSFRLIDTAAAGDATASAANYDTTISQLAQTHDGVEKMSSKWATLETGGWPLDGTCDILPDSLSELQTGLWSIISGADGTFSTPPTLTFNFDSAHSSIGFTVLFDDKVYWYPKTMTITAYNASNAVIDSETVTVTGVKQIVEMPVENYRKVVISFGETWQPYQKVHICEVIFGIVQEFDKTNMAGGKLLYEVSPSAISLPANMLDIVIDNHDRKYNMGSPNSLYAYLEKTQPLDVEIGVGASRNALEYVSMGRFYFAKSEARDRSMTAQITAYDRMYQLDRSVCHIGVTGTWTVAAAVAAVIADSGLTIATSIPAAIGSRIINKCIPSDASHREALRLIAHAARCTCYFNRGDTLVFSEIAVGAPVAVLGINDAIEAPEPMVSERINTVALTVKDEYSGVETIYTAVSVGEGETAQVWSVSNPLGNQATADWLLAMAQHRLKYEIPERGNPALELADTVTITDVDSADHNTAIVKQTYSYDGVLGCETEAVV